VSGRRAPSPRMRWTEASPHPAPNRRWIADFTYIWTTEGWLYAAAVIDLFSRRVVGWSMSASTTAELVTDALVMAIWWRGKPDDCSPQSFGIGAAFSNPLVVGRGRSFPTQKACVVGHLLGQHGFERWAVSAKRLFGKSFSGGFRGGRHCDSSSGCGQSKAVGGWRGSPRRPSVTRRT
jgi:transposase InsO family protein